MVMWTAEVQVNSLSRTIGLSKFSPNMQKAIRRVMLVFPSGFAVSQNRAQPLESRDSLGHADVTNRDLQQFETFHYCTHESYAVIDTGCQRTAIGRNTLNNIASRLPADLSIKYERQSFKFTGIGGETVTTHVALIPVCFGQRPGMIRAAILEDTPDAPFLLSLPILKALNTTMHLSQQTMCFQAIQQFGRMFYNEKGQLCLRLFEFDSMSSGSNNSSDRWQVRKIIGDECHVFMLHENHENHEVLSKGKLHDVNVNQEPMQSVNDDQGIVTGSYESDVHLQNSNTHQVDAEPHPMSGAESMSQSNFEVSSKSFQASSIAETPSPDSISCLTDHGGQRQLPWQQACVHHTCRLAAEACGSMDAHDQQVEDSIASGYHGQTHDRVGNPFDACVDPSTGNDDACGRHGGNRYSARDDEQHGPGQETSGERRQAMQEGIRVCAQTSEEQQVKQSGKLLSGFCRDSGHSDDATAIKLQPGSPRTCTQNSTVLLRPDSGEIHMPETGKQLHAPVLQVPSGASVPESVPLLLLPMDSRDQGRRIRENVCLFTGVQEASHHTDEVKRALRRRLLVMRRTRRGISESIEPRCKEKPKDIKVTTTSSMPTSLESQGHQRPCEDPNVRQVRTSGELSSRQGAPGGSTLCGRDQDEEIRATPCTEPVSLKPGQRKRILGDIQQGIEQYESNHLHDDVEPQMDENQEQQQSHMSPEFVQELFHLKLIGEVFSPERFVCSAGTQAWTPARTSFWPPIGSSIFMCQTAYAVHPTHCWQSVWFGSCDSTMHYVFYAAIPGTRQVQGSMYEWPRVSTEI